MKLTDVHLLAFFKENRQVASGPISILPRSKAEPAEHPFVVERRFGGEGRMSFLKSQAEQ